MSPSREHLYYALLAYGVFVSLLGLLQPGGRDAFLALPLLAVALIPSIRAGLGDVLLYASALYLSAVTGLVAAPLLVLSPLVFRPGELRAWRSRLILGPAMRRFLVYAAATSIGAVVYPAVLLYAVLAVMAGLLYASMSYAGLKRVELRLLHAPERLVMGSRGSMVIGGFVDKPVWLEAYASGKMVSSKALSPGRWRLSIPLDTGRIGTHHVGLEIYLLDTNGAAQRRALATILEYRVVPETRLVARRYRGLAGVSGAGEGQGLEIGVYEAAGSGSSSRLRRLSLERLVAALREGVARHAPGRPGGVVDAIAAGLAEYMASLLSTKRGRLGEYVSSRLYVPGDDVRSIHWKKSVKLQELVVKEYAVGSGAAGGLGGGGGQVVLVADLTASNPRDLDKVLRSVIESLADQVNASPGSETLLLLHQAGRYLVLRGSSAEVLEALGRALESYNPVLLYDYVSIAEPPGIGAAARIALDDDPMLPTVRGIRGYADAATKLLTTWGARRGARILIIHTRATIVRNSFLEHVLRELIGDNVRRVMVGMSRGS